AHELRNSLGVLTNAVAYLELAIPMDDQTIKKNFNHMKENVARANKVISDLLDFARDTRAAKSVFSISAVMDGALKDQKIPGGIKVEKRCPEGSYPVFADRDQVYHIIFNLLKNAVEAMTAPDGKSEEGKLILNCRRDNEGKVILSISDTGIGIPPEDKEKIFEPLFTGKSSGIGLGLSISQRYAELNGGSLKVDSEAGVGSTFILTLPGGDNTGERTQIHTGESTQIHTD
ncbi:MAG TPA: HAMP domain-containing histidine kinase, partial [Proteobacteria bacterium]|nr:HAMP domain-containing histidine kinase [Pseudomonadota bacterium]